MSGYTSGKALNDPKPMVNYGEDGIPNAYSRHPRYSDCSALCVYSPRPEFDNHNPILVAYRAEPDLDLWDMGFAIHSTYGGMRDWEQPDHYFHSFTTATPEQVQHARRVLTKLAVFS